MNEEQIKELISKDRENNDRSGTPMISPHHHDGVDNLRINPNDLLGFTIQTVASATVAPTDQPENGTIRFQFDGTKLTSWLFNNRTWYGLSATPGGVNGDLQINASGSFGTIGGLNLDQTGNARGAGALDIQTTRSAVTQVASGADSIAIGQQDTASNKYSVAIGWNNVSSGYGGTASGYHNTTSGAYTVASGYNNTSSGKGSVAVGYSNTSSATYSVAIGVNNQARGTDDVAIGTASTTKSGGYSSIAIGATAVVSSNTGIAIGANATASAVNAIVLGVSANNGTTNSTLICAPGNNSRVQVSDGLIEIKTANASTTGAISIYSGVQATIANVGNVNLSVSGNHSLPTTGGDMNFVTKNNFNFNMNIAAGSTGHMTINTGNDPGAGGGDGVITIQNAITNPTTNPSGGGTGGGILYVTGGALHWRGPAGTDTAIAPA